MARMERQMDLQREFKAVSASYGDTVLNLVVASGYLSGQIGNPRLSGYLESHHPEILTECLPSIRWVSTQRTSLMRSASSFGSCRPSASFWRCWLIERVRFAHDSPLEGDGFELSLEIRPEENCGFWGLAISTIVSQTGAK
jgi:hypothetical protein